MINVGRIKGGICFNCKKAFDEGVELDFNKKFFNNYKLCKNCAKSLFLGLSQEFIPKGVPNKICKCKIIENE